jgi:phosphatidylglycerol:prolipoprotein diacylglycerol transferase
LGEFPYLGWTVWSHQTLLAVAIGGALLFGPRWMERLEGIGASRTRAVLLWLTLAQIAGGRVHFLINNWSLFADRPLGAFRFWTGGLHAVGAVVATIIACPWVLRAYGIPLGKFADAMVPIAGLGVATARLGCFLHGCCFGTICAWPWCVSFPPEAHVYALHHANGLVSEWASRSAPVHPLQLYFAAAALLIVAAALWLRPYKQYDGQVGLVALVLFALSSAGLELLRADEPVRVYWGPLPQLLWSALGLALVSMLGLLAAQRAHARPRPSPFSGRD